jgi:hypothetical protein
VEGTSLNPQIVSAFINAGLIPDCAMAVQQTQNVELSPLQSYPTLPTQELCTCYFLSQAEPTPGTPAGCQTCTSNSQCPVARPHCNLGFCEVQ